MDQEAMLDEREAMLNEREAMLDEREAMCGGGCWVIIMPSLRPYNNNKLKHLI